MATRETRTLTLSAAMDGMPPGHYNLLELYCGEEGCDCRRVQIRVVTSPPAFRTMATISYGWESPEFYDAWGGAGAFLDPLNEQSAYARAFLRFFIRHVEEDDAYRRRLIRHYELFKGLPVTGEAGAPSRQPGSTPAAAPANRGARRRAERLRRRRPGC